jgi:hypothetical protein
MQRNSIEDRLKDYVEALVWWLRDSPAKHIVVVENSGYDLSVLRQVERDNAGHNGKIVEFISFDGQDFPRHLGKGYGEIVSLRQAVESSRLLAECGRFVKVNGRYCVTNIDCFIEAVASGGDIVCDLSYNLCYSDSRVFGGTLEFLRDYLLKEGQLVNDTEGIYLEHALARAAHRALADGKVWSLPPCLPAIHGISGTFDKPLESRWYHVLHNKIRYSLKRAMFRLPPLRV